MAFSKSDKKLSFADIMDVYCEIRIAIPSI